ncbi:hypothetical protein AXF42_Ash000668 [Apostasia shenzhenica]|uniref:Uncharacterized protein n=1 Tax=Apostasia shenzhenica TaxID=1088818 RepID=A0A2I0AGZ8_9ASPA|nr:hypothetical protein AXF42_Ash000668 [Apostasia shenzhenica]
MAFNCRLVLFLFLFLFLFTAMVSIAAAQPAGDHQVATVGEFQRAIQLLNFLTRWWNRLQTGGFAAAGLMRILGEVHMYRASVAVVGASQSFRIEFWGICSYYIRSPDGRTRFLLGAVGHSRGDHRSVEW